MKNNLWIGLALLFIISGLVHIVSCAGKTIEADPSLSQASSQVSEDEAARQKEEEELRLAEKKDRKNLNGNGFLRKNA
jgi:hypothetical protein